MNILIVDDLKQHLKLLRVTLESEGATVIEAGNGIEALAVLERESVDGIVSDVVMPKMGGYELCTKVRVNRKYDKIPFLFCTSMFTSPSDEKSALQLGADAFLRKPVSAELIIDTIRRITSSAKKRRRPSASLSNGKVLREYTDQLLLNLEGKTLELETLTSELRRLSRAVEQTADNVVVTNKDGIIEYVNPSFEELTGYKKEEVIGKTPRILKSGELDDSFYKRLWETILGGKSFRATFINRKKNSQLYFEEQTITPLVDESGSITSFVSTGKDVTERLQAERAQRVLYKVSQEAGYAPDLESLFRSVHSIIGEVMPARNFYIALHSKGEDTISFPYFIDERDEPTPPQKFGKGLTEYVLRTGASLLCDSMKHRELMETGEAELVGEASPIWLGVPLTIDKRTVGVMALQDYENERAYGKKEVEILEFVSGQVARAIQRKQAEEMLATAHHQLESLHESLDLAVFSVDMKTDQILQASPAHERVFGYSAERFFENPRLWYEIIIPEDKPIVDAGYPTLMAGKLLRHEFRIRRPNGDVTWVEAQMKPTLDREGALVRLDGIATDITEKKLAEQDLANELNFNKTIIDQSPVGIIAYNAAGAAISANEAVARITGGTREQLLSQNYHHIESWKRSGLLAKALEARDTGKESECEASVQTTFGKEVWLSCRFVPFEYHGEKHLLVHFIDNTAEKHAQDHLEQSEKELRALFGAMTDVVLVLDEQGRYVRIAPTNPVNLYVPPKDLLGRHVGDVLPKTDADLVMRKIKECLESGKQVIYEYHLEIGDRMIWFEGRVSPLSETSVFFIARDITERKLAEAKTEEQAKLLELASDAIVVRGLDDVVHFWNSGAEKLYGWPKEEAVGKKIKDLIYSTIEEFDQAQAVVLGEGSWFGELRQRTKAGKEIVANSRWTLVRDASGKPKSILVINSDITMKKQLEVHALRAQRLESIGTLAGGIAHDLNNALGPILLGIQVIANHVTDSRARQLLESMEGSAKRGAEMVKQILAFAKGFSGEFGILGLKHVIREAQNIIRETFPKNIDLDVQISGNLWNIMGDSTQLHQLLINLCVNARDAMASGGRLTISAENFTVDETYAQMHSGLKAGPHVLLKVVDTGTGMPKDVMEKIFDPFFTTKDSGKGTGLGLSTVATIVKGHTGAVGVYSEPRRGTTFRILLPALPGAESKAHVDQSEMPRGNGEMLLVVDDEITLREMTKQTLEMFGYTVLTAADGTEAVTQFIGHKGQVAAVITDMAMPVMDGEATIRALRRIDPNVRIIATSGQHNTISENVVKRLEIERSLLKPFTAEQLLRTLSVVLGNKEGGVNGGRLAPNSVFGEVGSQKSEVRTQRSEVGGIENRKHQATNRNETEKRKRKRVFCFLFRLGGIVPHLR